MIFVTESKIIVDGKERVINIEELSNLSQTHLPEEIGEKFRDEFVNEVKFRISDLSLDSEDCGGKSVEEYYFSACLAYVRDKGFAQFFEEEDDGNIFDYCGSIL